MNRYLYMEGYSKPALDIVMSVGDRVIATEQYKLSGSASINARGVIIRRHTFSDDWVQRYDVRWDNWIGDKNNISYGLNSGHISYE